MPINICNHCGRITGFRHCPHHETDKGVTRQAPPYFSAETVAPAEQPKQAAPRVSIRGWFRTWREAHRAKVMERRAAA